MFCHSSSNASFFLFTYSFFHLSKKLSFCLKWFLEKWERCLLIRYLSSRKKTHFQFNLLELENLENILIKFMQNILNFNWLLSAARFLQYFPDRTEHVMPLFALQVLHWLLIPTEIISFKKLEWHMCFNMQFNAFCWFPYIYFCDICLKILMVLIINIGIFNLID